PLPAAASPTAESPGYIPESDPDEDLEEDVDEDPEEDPADYPANHDDDDEEEEEPSGDDADEEDEEQDKDDDDEEDEHPASADSIPPPPALHLLSSDRRADRPEVTLPPRKRLNIVYCPGYEAGESSVAAAARPIEGRWADYGFVDSVEAEIRRRRAEDIRYGIRDTWIDLRDKMAPKKAAPKRTTRLNLGATSNPNQAPSTTTTTVPNAQLQAMIDQGVNTALAARDANQTGDDNHTSGTGVRRTERVTQECTYQDFMKCQPLYFKVTEGVVELTQWFERMETVFRISNCLAENQVKFATCTLLAGALTWWNSHVRIVGNDAAYVMTWIELKKKMADK
nr:hypothetical protein [Tanacetum cinerariifolium]